MYFIIQFCTNSIHHDPFPWTKGFEMSNAERKLLTEPRTLSKVEKFTEKFLLSSTESISRPRLLLPLKWSYTKIGLTILKILQYRDINKIQVSRFLKKRQKS